MSWLGEWVPKALVTEAVLFATYPFLIPPEGMEDGGPGSALVDFSSWGLAFCVWEGRCSYSGSEPPSSLCLAQPMLR